MSYNTGIDDLKNSFSLWYTCISNELYVVMCTCMMMYDDPHFFVCTESLFTSKPNQENWRLKLCSDIDWSWFIWQSNHKDWKPWSFGQLRVSDICELQFISRN